MHGEAMTKLLATSAAVFALAAPVFAQTVTSAEPSAIQMTIYNADMALVSDTRRVTLSSGEQVIELPGVSSQIRPTTATFLAPDIDILEQNFDFDLLSPEKLMEKAVGGFVEVVRTNPGNGRITRERARVLSVNNGVVVEIDGRIEVLRDDDIPTRVVFPDVPENLRADPTLSITLDSTRAGTRDATLSYLTGGLGWESDYVASFDEAAGTLDLQGWATLTNTTETTFADAKVAVVAGDVAGVQQQQFDRFGNYNPRFNPRGNIRGAGVEASEQERIGDNLLYPLPGTITVRANQTKQVGIVDVTGIPAAKIYEYRARGYQTNQTPQPVDVRVGFSNSGAALPAGTLRVYQRDASERSQFIGEDRLDHTPSGSDLAVKIGEAFDIRVQPNVTNDNRISRRVRDVSMNYKVTNASRQPVTVQIRQSTSGRWLDTEVTQESQSHRESDAYTYVWDVEVPAEGDRTLTFTVRERSRW